VPKPPCSCETLAMIPPTREGRYVATVGSQRVELPIVALDTQRAVALLVTVDRGVAFIGRAGMELAALLSDSEPEIVASAATLGIPVALEVSRALGLDDYLVLHKSPKIHLAEALRASLRSITTDRPQELLLDQARRSAVEGRRVAFVDDVISTGSSAAAAIGLLRAAGADVVAVGALLTETGRWRAVLGSDAALVRALGHLPVLVADDDGWSECWD